MGGGRSGLFHGTKNADEYQQTFFPEPFAVRKRGAIYISNTEGTVGGGIVAKHPNSKKLHVLTAKEIFEKFMDYRYGDVSESQLVQWLKKVLTSEHYYVEPSLRCILTSGLADLKATKTVSRGYDKRCFLAVIKRIESKLS